MSWTASLQPASFRGVRFGVLGASKDFGKRVITHLFPLRDDPFHETMGRLPRAFAIDAFIVGDDVVSRVKRLEAAIETKGPGRLVHPYYGSLTVEALAGSTAFAAFEGRVARVQIAFEEAGRSPAPLGFVNAAVSLLSSVSAVADIVLGAVGEALAIVGEVAFVVDGVVSDVRAIGFALSSGLGLAGLGGSAEALGAIVRSASGRDETIPDTLRGLQAIGADDLGNGAGAVALVSATLLALAALRPAPSGGFASDPDPRVAVVDALLGLGAVLPVSTAGGATASRLVQAGNRDRLALLVRSTATLAAMSAATSVEWDSRDQLGVYGAAIAEALDEAADLAGALGLDDAWRALCDAGSSWAAYVAGASPPLPTVAIVTPPQTVGASLLAYRLDGDALADLFDRGGRIVRRNRVRHPGFLPGAVPLEVVGHG